MKGLIIKDIMCLKKQLMIFLYVIICVVVISIMFVLSARYGNIATVGQNMMLENDMTHEEIKDLATMALILFMLLPIAMAGDMTNVFAADGKAGFYKISGALPVNLKKRILARYLSIYALVGISVIIDILLAFVLSILTDIISFKDFLGIIMSSASIMSIYSALVIFFCLLLGYGKEQHSLIISMTIIFLAAILWNFKTIKKLFQGVAAGGSSEPLSLDMLDFIKEKSWVLVLVAIAVSILSYVASYQISERKRGAI